MRAAFGSALLCAGAAEACSATPKRSEPEAGPARDSGREASGDAAVEASLDAAADVVDVDCYGKPDLDAAYLLDELEICPLVLPCGLPPGITLSGCNLVYVSGGGALGCTVAAEGGCDGGLALPEAGEALPVSCDCAIFPGGGRRPEGWDGGQGPRGRRPLARLLARLAAEEAASVHAFRRLTDELRELGAPAAFVSEATRSMRDEVRHARMMAALARRRGGEPAPLRIGPLPLRGLEAVATENAAEGCVRETYGAALAAWQGAHASDADLRRALAEIAEDETRHAALAWAVADWAEPRLSPAARRRVRGRRREATLALRRSVSTPLSAAARAAGLPPPRIARVLVDELFRRLDV